MSAAKTTSTGLRVQVLGAALLGPGLPDWAAARAVLGGCAPYGAQPTVIPAPQRLPAAERRRAGAAVKLAVALADAACADAGLEPAGLPTVFASSSGDGANCHALCEALASDDRLVSPTRFTNSVHNAAAGYWHIAVSGMQASTSVCAHDASFGAGLLEAALQVAQTGRPVLLVCSDATYPEPLHGVRPLMASVGVGLVLGPAADASVPSPHPHLTLRLLPADGAGTVPGATHCRDAGIETLRRETPAGRALPLFEALARSAAAVVTLDHQSALSLQLDLLPPPSTPPPPAASA